jgi:hypothetical protein
VSSADELAAQTAEFPGWHVRRRHVDPRRRCEASTVLPRNSFNPLTRSCDAPLDEPHTVGDVMGLYTRRQLREIRGLGRRRISEIEAALVLDNRRQPPAGTEGPVR